MRFRSHSGVCEIEPDTVVNYLPNARNILNHYLGGLTLLSGPEVTGERDNPVRYLHKRRSE
jgi:hypothetical protein